MAKFGTGVHRKDHRARPSLSQRVYMGLVWGEPIPDEYVVWEMAGEFGWSLEYITNLPEARWREWFEVKAGKGMARNSIVGKGAPNGRTKNR
jgi:hypothetical protein